jgi:hypothetical protein
MSPQVDAAWIAAGVSAATLIGTLAAQYFSRRATRHDLEEQREQQKRTAAEQREQLDRTLGEQRTRTLNERFAMAAGQLGDDKPSAVRLAGVYAMEGLADDWPERRQTCVDVLCGYLRMPYGDESEPKAPGPERPALRAQRYREVRHTVIRVITSHLQADIAEAKSWQGLDFDFTGVVFDGGSFAGAVFSGGEVNFSSARFPSGTVDFTGAAFCGSTVDFDDANFSGGVVRFDGAVFSGGEVYFGAEFSGGGVSFSQAKFSGGTVSFDQAGDWSHPPTFDWVGTPPPGVKLPNRGGQSRT